MTPETRGLGMTNLSRILRLLAPVAVLAGFLPGADFAHANTVAIIFHLCAVDHERRFCRDRPRA